MIVVLLITVPLFTAKKTIQDFPIQQKYSEKWDAQNSDIIRQRDLGVKNNKTSSTPYYLANLKLIIGDASYWTSRCATMYYGVESIICQ